MGFIDNILEKFDLDYKELSADERKTLEGWLVDLDKGQLTVEKIKDYVTACKNAVEGELATHKHEDKQDLFLKARLRNYLMLEAFLTGPKRAREAIEKALGSFKAKT